MATAKHSQGIREREQVLYAADAVAIGQDEKTMKRPTTKRTTKRINRSIKRKICIDFDGTIYPNPYKDNRIDNDTPPTDGFIEFYQRYVSTHVMVVNSARCEDEYQITLIERYLIANKIPMKVTRYKPMAHYYVDDKAVPYTGDWLSVSGAIQ